MGCGQAEQFGFYVFSAIIADIFNEKCIDCKDVGDRYSNTD